MGFILRLTAQKQQGQRNGCFRAECTVNIHSVLNYIDLTCPLQDLFLKKTCLPSKPPRFKSVGIIQKGGYMPAAGRYPGR